MPKTRIGRLNFDAGHRNDPVVNGGSEDTVFDIAYRGIDLHTYLYWNCVNQTLRPATLPKKFQDVEAKLLIHHNPAAPFRNDLDIINPANRRALAELVGLCGFDSPKAMVEDMNSRFGIYTPALDLHGLIADLKERFRLRIDVWLKFEKFELTHPRCNPEWRLILSLPDHWFIEIKKIGECTEDGVEEYDPGRDLHPAPPPIPIRAKTQQAFSLRRSRRQEQIDLRLGDIRRARARIAEERAEIETIKPEGD